VGSPVRVAVLGLGRIGRMHADLLAREVDGAEVAVAADVVDAAVEAVAGRLGVDGSTDPAAALARDDVDAVAICTPTPTHVDLLVAAARAGKAVFCEKPVSLDLADTDVGLAAAAGAGVVLQVGFNRRFDPGHAAVRDAVAGGEVGTPELVRISSRDPAPPPLDYLRTSGGILRDQTIHDFDMARFVTGSEVVEVHAAGAVRVDPAIGELGDLDTLVVTLRHADGCLTLVDNSRRAAYGFDQRVEVLGSRGVAASGNLPVHGAVVRTPEGARGATLPWFFIERYLPSYALQWAAFVAAVRGDAPVLVGGADARAALVLCLAAARSVERGVPVTVDEVT
jgi:myo-inositol 2-dehydrogenase/D-chiro-inositol 1-dehydrogenase